MANDKETHKDKKGSEVEGAEVEKGTKVKASSKTEEKKAKPASRKPKGSAESSEPKAAKKPKGSAPAAPRRPLIGGTYAAKVGEYQIKWKVVDAKGLPLGRMCSHIASILMGKTNPTYTRSSDTGDHVIVINADKVVLTGNKWKDKKYYYHTNYPGGIKTFTASELLEKRPKKLVEWAVHGMLPKGHMGRKWYKKLWVYTGTEHPHAAQKPEMVKTPDLGFWERT